MPILIFDSIAMFVAHKPLERQAGVSQGWSAFQFQVTFDA